MLRLLIPFVSLVCHVVSTPVYSPLPVVTSVPPMIWVPNQLIGAGIMEEAILTCNTEAFPPSINYWTRGEVEDALSPSHKFDISIVEKSYKIFMTLRIRDLSQEDFTSYKCYARNALGSTEGSIKLYGKLQVKSFASFAFHFDFTFKLTLHGV